MKLKKILEKSLENKKSLEQEIEKLENRIKEKEEVKRIFEEMELTSHNKYGEKKETEDEKRIEQEIKELEKEMEYDKECIRTLKEKKNSSQNEYDRKKELEDQLKNLKLRDKLEKTIIKILISISIILLILSVLIYFNIIPSKEGHDFSLEYKKLLVLTTVFTTISSFSLLSSSKNKTFEKIKETSDELDYVNLENESDILKAEKQFKLHQNELQKYYNLNLSQSQKIFYIGIFCIVIGFGIIGYTLWILSTQENIKHGMELVLTGGIGGILSNFIGIIYLKMYSETLKVLIEFHNKLVYTHNLHFSNYLLAKVETKEMKEKILHEAILKIVTKEKDI